MRPSPENAELQAIIAKLQADDEAERRKAARDRERRRAAGPESAPRRDAPDGSESAAVVDRYRRRAAAIAKLKADNRAGAAVCSREAQRAFNQQWACFFYNRRPPPELESVANRERIRLFNLARQLAYGAPKPPPAPPGGFRHAQGPAAAPRGFRHAQGPVNSRAERERREFARKLARYRKPL